MVIGLVGAAMPALQARGYWAELVGLSTLALQAALPTGDRRGGGAARAEADRGHLNGWLGHTEEENAHPELALRLARDW
jgi:hypothetical protein